MSRPKVNEEQEIGYVKQQIPAVGSPIKIPKIQPVNNAADNFESLIFNEGWNACLKYLRKLNGLA